MNIETFAEVVKLLKDNGKAPVILEDGHSMVAISPQLGGSF